MIRIGIECEQLEGARFGVGHTLAQLLEALVKTPEIEKKYRFVLYFKKEIPKDDFLAHSVFEKKILTGGWIPPSFNIFYHILIPIAYWRDQLNLYFFPSYMLPAFFIGKSIVVLTNDAYWEAHYGNLSFRYRLSYRLFCWWAAKRANKIFTISEFSASELQKFYNISKERIFVNPWGMEWIFKIFPRTNEYREKITAIKQRYHIKDRFFLSFGQAFPRRHVKEAVEAFGRIAHEFPNVQYLVGCVDKHMPPVLKDLAEKINSAERREAVIITDYLPRADMPYLMNEIVALLYVSSCEALGIPPIEAGLCGKPAIIADIPTNKEVFGDTGFFVRQHDDPEEIAMLMREILSDERKTHEILLRQAPFIARYTWEAHARRLLNIFDEIITK